MSGRQLGHMAETYASDFLENLRLDSALEERCQFSCVLWSKDYWAGQAHKAKMNLQYSKEYLSDSQENAESLEAQFLDSEFQNTVAKVYSQLFSAEEESGVAKDFQGCPFMTA